MEHLPTPENPLCLQIPHLGDDNSYDGKGFLDFPKRQNREEQDFLDQMWQTENPQGTLAMLQSWLYFGFLEEFLRQVWNVKMEKLDFIQKRGTDSFVTTELLKKKYYHEFQRERANMDRKGRAVFAKRAEVLLVSLFNRFGQVFAGGEFEDMVRGCRGSEEIPFSIRVIAETLQDVTVDTLGTRRIYFSADSSRIRPKLNLDWHVFTSDFDILRSRMMENGWCPSEVRHLLDNLKVRGQYYVSNFRRQGPVLSHGDACSDSECALKRFDEASYQSRHRRDSCSCQPMFVAEAQSEALLQKGRIPRLTIARKYIAQYVPAAIEREEVVRVVESEKYIAISHVWSQGLGNVGANALPQCQLSFLQDLVQDLYPPHHAPVPLWIDTLCIPRNSEGRKTGLKLIRKTYAEADKVLVIDSELLRVGQIPSEERLMRVISSEWMTRLWTLEEAIVAGAKLYVQFADHAINLRDSLEDQLFRARHSEHTFPLWLLACGRDKVFDDLLDIFLMGVERDEDQKRSILFKILHNRQTSKSADETICIASVLNANVESLLETPPKKRIC